MDVSVKRLRRMLLNACEKTGVADDDTLLVDAAENALEIASTRVSIALVRGDRRQEWQVRHSYDTADLGTGNWRSVSEVVGTFAVNEEARAVKAAMMKVLDFIVDAAIDEAS